MYYYTLIVAYDGTWYHGWQKQKDLPSIAGTLERAFFHVFHRPVKLKGVSRTDAGVHALGQLVSISIDFAIEPEALKRAWNFALPPDIVIRSIKVQHKQIHIFNTIDYKIYYYHFFVQRPLPFVQQYGWYLKQPLDMQKLMHALHIFKGTHDFRSFCSSEDERECMIRTIDQIELEYIKRFGVYRIKVVGSAFLRHMIRRIVGASITVATRNTLPVSVLQKALAEKDPEQTLENAPAKGLLLYKIITK